MFDPKIKLSRTLYDRLARLAQIKGYASVDEYIRHILEKAAAEADQDESEDKVRERLKGLGYL